MKFDKRVLLASAAASLLVAEPAAAQIRGSLDQASDAQTNFRRDRNVSVRQRPHPGYEAIGLRAGAFMVWPKLNASLERNDNIFATANNEQEDTVFRLAPELAVQSTWSRHALNGYARAVVNRFSDFETENTEDYTVGATGRIDVLRSAQVNAGLDWSRLTEPRTSANAQGQARPVQFEQTTAYLAGSREFNRLRLSARGDLRNYIYLAQRGNRPQDDRDRTQYSLLGRADYAVSPDTALFVQVAGNQRNYRVETASVALFPGFVNRDSEGVEVLAGANFELSAVARGEIGVGYLQQSFDDPGFDDIDGLGARGQVEWFPSQLVTVTLTGSRTVEDAGIVGSSGYLATNLGAQVDYELLRNVIVTGQASWGEDDYRGIDREDIRKSAGLSATYLMNRHVGVTVSYNHFRQDSSGVQGGEDFKVNRIGATLTLQY